MAAVLGGTQSLHCNSRDEALGLPTEESARIALRTQQIIASETGVTNTVDPAGGSYVIEALTDEIESAAEALLARIEAAGGVLAAVESGFIQREIQESAYRAQIGIDNGSAVVVGVNRYQETDGSTAAPAQVFQIDPELERQQVARVQAVRASRDARAHRETLARVASAARDSTNLVPPILEAVEALATLGEISDTLRGVFGEYQETATL